MLNFTENNLHLGFTVLDSLMNHTWYRTEQWVIVCLADANCPEQERKCVASVLPSTSRQETFSPDKPALPQDLWPENGEMPSLSTFVGQKSWLLPHLLNLSDENMEWLNVDVH